MGRSLSERLFVDSIFLMLRRQKKSNARGKTKPSFMINSSPVHRGFPRKQCLDRGFCRKCQGLTDSYMCDIIPCLIYYISYRVQLEFMFALLAQHYVGLHNCDSRVDFRTSYGDCMHKKCHVIWGFKYDLSDCTERKRKYQKPQGTKDR